LRSVSKSQKQLPSFLRCACSAAEKSMKNCNKKADHLSSRSISDKLLQLTAGLQRRRRHDSRAPPVRGQPDNASLR
jgi:hypothetical protein